MVGMMKLPLHPGANGQTRTKNGNISQTCYYAYRLHQRRNEPSTILQGGRLFQQWIVDGWASTEQSKLTIRNNQKSCVQMSTKAFVMLSANSTMLISMKLASV